MYISISQKHNFCIYHAYIICQINFNAIGETSPIATIIKSLILIDELFLPPQKDVACGFAPRLYDSYLNLSCSMAN